MKYDRKTGWQYEWNQKNRKQKEHGVSGKEYRKENSKCV